MEGTMRSLWRRLPVVVRAVLAGGAVLVAGTVPWALLVDANRRWLPAVPWAVVPAVLYLWLFWRYLRGEGWPRETADARRASLRANELSGDVWGAAILAGVLGLVGVLALMRVMSHMVHLPQQENPEALRLPAATLLMLVLVGAAVAGVVEESAMRGYMQGPIERRHGPVVAILVSGAVFGFAHFTHPEVTLALMPYYLAVAAVYGTVTYLTNSILPAITLHAGGNVWSGIGLLAAGQSEWQAPTAPRPLIWEAGPDASFWLALAALVIVGGLAVGAFSALATVARRERSPLGSGAAVDAARPGRHSPGRP
jgi:membrane protease YdiL (CAAX protease family)